MPGLGYNNWPGERSTNLIGTKTAADQQNEDSMKMLHWGMGWVKKSELMARLAGKRPYHLCVVVLPHAGTEVGRYHA